MIQLSIEFDQPKTASLTIGRMKELLDCDVETGTLTWKLTRGNVKAGTVAGHKKPCSRTHYLIVRIDRVNHRAHRLVWAFAHNRFPDLHLDHINQNGLDNRIENLREVTAAENHRNRRMSRDNKSGAAGVCWHKQTKKWHAHIRVDGKNIHLGYFDDRSEAIAARLEANDRYGFHSNHGRKDSA